MYTESSTAQRHLCVRAFQTLKFAHFHGSVNKGLESIIRLIVRIRVSSIKETIVVRSSKKRSWSFSSTIFCRVVQWVVHSLTNKNVCSCIPNSEIRSLFMISKPRKPVNGRKAARGVRIWCWPRCKVIHVLIALAVAAKRLLRSLPATRFARDASLPPVVNKMKTHPLVRASSSYVCFTRTAFACRVSVGLQSRRTVFNRLERTARSVLASWLPRAS